MWKVGCGKSDVECRMWNIGCGMSDVECRMLNVECGIIFPDKRLREKSFFFENFKKWICG
jgi:hypothetical protein